MLTKLTLYVDTVLFGVLLLCDYVYTYMFLVVSLCTDTVFVDCAISMCSFLNHLNIDFNLTISSLCTSHDVINSESN